MHNVHVQSPATSSRSGKVRPFSATYEEQLSLRNTQLWWKTVRKAPSSWPHSQRIPHCQKLRYNCYFQIPELLFHVCLCDWLVLYGSELQRRSSAESLKACSQNFKVVASSCLKIRRAFFFLQKWHQAMSSMMRLLKKSFFYTQFSKGLNILACLTVSSEATLP